MNEHRWKVVFCALAAVTNGIIVTVATFIAQNVYIHSPRGELPAISRVLLPLATNVGFVLAVVVAGAAFACGFSAARQARTTNESVLFAASTVLLSTSYAGAVLWAAWLPFSWL